MSAASASSSGSGGATSTPHEPHAISVHARRPSASRLGIASQGRYAPCSCTFVGAGAHPAGSGGAVAAGPRVASEYTPYASPSSRSCGRSLVFGPTSSSGLPACDASPSGVIGRETRRMVAEGRAGSEER
eukprot:scaffold169824_cov28-Tisochrysis_lutea.AAC.1